MPVTTTLWPLMISAMLFIAGGWLLRRSWWPRRVGSAPHCRRCGYNVDAIPSQRCPECGAALTPQDVVHGHRHRRPGMALLAVTMLLCAVAMGGLYAEQQWLRKIDWYRYRPFAWLIEDLNRSSDSLA